MKRKSRRGRKPSRARNVVCNGKRRFRDHDEAMQALRHITRHSDRNRLPVRAYECGKCQGWHLTSWKLGAS